jgi:hypothetical protein
LWFSFCDATDGFVLGAALTLFMPHLQGVRRLWLLILPSFTYASTLGSTTAQVSLTLNSGWSTPVVWAGGTATMLMCLIVVHVVAQLSEARARALA